MQRVAYRIRHQYHLGKHFVARATVQIRHRLDRGRRKLVKHGEVVGMRQLHQELRVHGDPGRWPDDVRRRCHRHRLLG